MKRGRLLGVVTLLAAVLSLTTVFYAAYNYTPVLFNTPGAWQFNGAVAVNGTDLVTSGSGNGSAVYLGSLSSTVEYEVRSTIRLTTSGGNYLTFLRSADNNPMNSSGIQGQWFAVELVNPTFSSAPGQPCTATLAITQRIGGTYSILSMMSVPCRNQMQIRAVIINYNATAGAVMAYVDNKRYLYANISSAANGSGRPGAGLINAPAGNGVSMFEIGYRDPGAPNAPTAQLVSTWTFPNRVDFQIKPPADTGGADTTTGVTMFQLYRWNGSTWDLKVQSDATGFSDTTVSPGVNYTYKVEAVDFHNNVGPSYQFTAQTPPAGSVDPRGAGLRPTASTWGALGEQLDMQSGNLNFTMPLAKAQARGGLSATFSLNYNSQVWRRDPSTTWLLAEDVGYGFGWKLMAGSLQTFRDSFWSVHHYRFTDNTGAEYILNANNGGVWTSSQEPVYIAYQESTNRLYFPDGSFWVMDVVSAGEEHDQGTRYPSIMEDRNGNQILIRYAAGRGAAWPSSSARITDIEDVRAVQNVATTYTFTYNGDPIPHLTNITNNIKTGEKYGFSYTAAQNFTSPFGTGEQFGPYQTLSTVSLTGVGLNTTFFYNSFGEMTQVLFPYGGTLGWNYSAFSFSGSRQYREIASRTFQKDSGAAATTHTLSREPGDSSLTVHSRATLDDVNGSGRKIWYFQTAAGAAQGLVTAYEAKASAAGAVLSRQEYTWSATAKPYVSVVLNRIEPGQSWEKQSKTEQTLDAWGNTTLLKEYNFGSGTAPESTASRVSTASFNASQVYQDRFIRNLPDNASNASGLWYFYYDQSAPQGPPLQFIKQHDPAYNTTSNVWRGNATGISGPAGPSLIVYDLAGNVKQVSSNGQNQTLTVPQANNYAAPSKVTPNGNTTLETSLFYTESLGLKGATGPNQAGWTSSHDDYGRLTAKTNPYGGGTGFSYNASPGWKVATTGTHWVKEWYDGIGRVKRVETGDTGGTKSLVATEYEPCACSPVGKVKRVSQPYAAGGSPTLWTVYTYDGLGRTLSIQHPGGTGMTTYSYQGNKTTVTDPAGKWKTTETDGFGNLIKVTEPRPGGGQYDTTYTYDAAGRLKTVSMPRDGTTQTRTFNYTAAGKILNETHPETGTTSFEYNSDNTLFRKTDAKGQKVEYGYDGNQRVTQVRKYKAGLVVEDPCQRVNYTYDGYAGYTQNGAGRLAAVSYGSTDTATCGGPGAFEEMYSYTQGGLVSSKKLRITRNVFGYGQRQGSMESFQSYNAEGQMTGQTYPWVYAPGSPAQPQPAKVYNIVYDLMGRLSQVKEGSFHHLSGISYGVGSEINSITYNNWTLTQYRYYNARLQMTRMWTPGFLDMEYEFSGTANNGQITAMTQRDGVGATVQRVAYTYDSLARLQNAQTTAGSVSWNLTFGMDGFGNLNSQTGSGAPNWSQPTNPQNNRLYTFGYDANGNTTSAPGTTLYDYDVENRLTKTTLPGGGGVEEYGYGTGNQRVWRRRAGTGEYEIYFYKVSGERFGKYSVGGLNNGNGDIGFFLLEQEEPVPGKLRYNRDRQGNVMYTANTVYFPYGEERTATVNDRDKFGTYHRDGPTGLDYANNRYYSTQSARFLTADPYRASSGPGDPGSWNRYPHSRGDTVNKSDPSGLADGPSDELVFCVYLGTTTTKTLCDLVSGGPPDQPPTTKQCSDGSTRMVNEPCPGDPINVELLGSGTVKEIRGLGRNGAVDLTWAGIRAALKGQPNSQCARWFDAGFASSDHAASGTLDRFLGEGMPIVSGAGAFVGGNANAVANFGTPGYVVAVNTLGAFFNPIARGQTLASSDKFESAFSSIRGNTDRARVFILLHELGHVLKMIETGDGVDSSDGRAAQRRNNDAVWSNCNSIINVFSN